MTQNTVTIDKDRMLVRRGDRICRLTPRQFSIVCYLAANPGFVRSRDQLMTQQSDTWVEILDKSVDSTIKRIRASLRRDIDVDPIGTLYGAGYFWREDL